MRRDIQFKSGGDICRGWLYTPDNGKGPFPTVIMAFGGGYVKEFPVVSAHAEMFAKAGLATVAFDYRTFGGSDGQPRLHLDPWAQIEDCRNGLSFAALQPEVDPDRLCIWGISIGGGHALVLPAVDSRIKCTVSVVGMVDGYRMQRRFGERRFQQLKEVIIEDRIKRFADKKQRMYLPQASPTPDEVLCCWPFPDVYEVFETDYKKTVAPAYENRWTVESMDLILNYTAFPYIPRLLNIPVLMIITEGDQITPWDIEIEAFNQIPSQEKELFITPTGATHMGVYAIPEYTKIIATEATKFLSEHMVKPYK